ncbi:MAG: hypothetical protein HZB84_00230 [Deltaproteobacteria bacterium]|nr:hypothetical protein [Deltaproteobacteria bacterium]
MKRAKIAVFAILFGLLVAFSASARDKDAEVEDLREYRLFQGVVGAYDGATMTVNENITVVMTQDTKVYDSRSKETSRLGIKVGKWVYVEGPVREDKGVDAEKVYILPRHIEQKDLPNYPFIQAP